MYQTEALLPTYEDKAQGVDRKRRIVIRNLKERENENIKDRVNNIIDYLKVREVSVEAAEKKPNNYNSKPGVVLATFYCNEDKEKVMKAKKNLRSSTRYRDVYIENDLPAHQRKLKNNLRTIVNTLGRETLKLRGSRVIRADENTDANQYRNDHENESRERNRTTHNYHESYDTRRTGSSRPYHNSYDDGRDDQYYYSRGRQDRRDRSPRDQGNGYRQR